MVGPDTGSHHRLRQRWGRAGASTLAALLGCVLLGVMAGPALAARHKHKKKTTTVFVHCAATTVHCQPTQGKTGAPGIAGMRGVPGSIIDVSATSTRPWSSSENVGIPMTKNVYTQKKGEDDLFGGWAMLTAPSSCSQGEALMAINVNGRFVTSGLGKWTMPGQQFIVGLGGPGTETEYLDSVGASAFVAGPAADTQNTVTVSFDFSECTAPGGGGSTVTVNSVTVLALSFI